MPSGLANAFLSVWIRWTPFPSAARLRPPPWGFRADFRQSSGARTRKGVRNRSSPEWV